MKLRTHFLIALSLAFATSTTVFAGNIENARNLVNKGNYLMAASKFPEALKTYEEALKCDPGNAVIKDNIVILHNNWARWLTRQKKYHEALEKFNKCLELSPSYSQAKTNISLLRRYAEADGVDLDLPPPDETQPRNDIPIPPSGVSPKPDQPKSDPKVQQAKVAPTEPEAGAVLFIGGVKQSTTPPPAVDAYPISATTAPSTQPSQPPSGASFAAPSGASFAAPSTTPSSVSQPVSSPANDFTAKPVNPLFPITPNQFPTQPVTAAPSAVAPASAPATPVVSFDDQISAVEMKVYGAKQTNMTVLQRLEKIERDASGQPRSGTILERIDNLKKNFGL